jgi:hypothetical protein
MKAAIFIGIFFIIILAFTLGQPSHNNASTETALPTDAPIPTDTPLPTPTPTPPEFLSDITAPTFKHTVEANGTYSVEFPFSNPYRRSVSIGISTTQFADPGPIADTTGTTWTFTNVPALSTQYVNMKAMVDGSWSTISSWTLQIPSWTAPVVPIYYSYPVVYYPQSTYTNCSSDYIGGVNCYSY